MSKRYVSPPNWPAPPAGWTPPPGWKPNPSWGPAPQNWIFWQEDQSWFARHKLITGLGGGGLGLLLIASVAGGTGSTTQSSTAPLSASSVAAPQPVPSASSSSAGPATAPPAVVAPTPNNALPSSSAPEPPKEPTADSEYGDYPTKEKQFVSEVQEAQAAAADSENDLQLGSALLRRNKALCKVVGSGKVDGWTGKISSLDSNGDGYGVLTIELADGTAVGTWNNALSDYADNTLIKPGELLDSLTELDDGQTVAFSGRFIKSDTCVNDKRLTKAGKLNDPEFVFKFSSVRKV